MEKDKDPRHGSEYQAKGGHGTLPTVKVVADNEQGYMVINEADFDDKAHTLYEEPKEPKKAKGKKADKDAE